MADMMTFPETVEEFMEQYKVVDTEHVYTNGTEFVPIFRMKQWFEHLPSVEPEIIKCKYCRWWDNDGESQYGYCHAIKHCYRDRHWEIDIYRRYKADFFCGDAERRTDDGR